MKIYELRDKFPLSSENIHINDKYRRLNRHIDIWNKKVNKFKDQDKQNMFIEEWKLKRHNIQLEIDLENIRYYSLIFV